MTLLPEEWEARKKLAVTGLIIGLILVGAGFFVWRTDAEPEVQVIRESDETRTGGDRVVVIDIEGAVVKPGVYKLNPGSRVTDAIEAAGGFTPDVDVNWVETRINKAERVNDGDKLYIPPKKEEQINTGAGNGMMNIISINFASKSELESLPGIGAVTADKIIQGRPYNKAEDLIDNKIVTRKVFEQIQNSISL